MQDKIIKNIIFVGLSTMMVFATIAKGSVTLWSMTVIEIIVSILTFCWLWHKNWTSNWHFKQTTLDKPILAFLILSTISAVFSIYKYESILALLLFTTYVTAYYLFINNFGSSLQLRFCVLITILATTLSVLGLSQYFLGFNHSWWKPYEFLASTYVNHNHFAGYLEMAILLCCGLILGLDLGRITNPIRLSLWRILLTVCLIISVSAFIFTQSRGGWISLAAALLFYNVILAKRKRFKKWTLAIFIVTLIVGVTFLYVGDDAVATRLQTIEKKGDESSWETREIIWAGTVQMIKEHPFLGTGIGTFEDGFPRFRPQGLDVRANYAHNDYLQAASEMGFLAAPLMLWIIFLIIKKGVSGNENDSRLIRNLRLASAVGILSLSLHGLVDFNFNIPSNMLLFVCLAAIVMRPSRQDKKS